MPLGAAVSHHASKQPPCRGLSPWTWLPRGEAHPTRSRRETRVEAEETGAHAPHVGPRAQTTGWVLANPFPGTAPPQTCFSRRRNAGTWPRRRVGKRSAGCAGVARAVALRTRGAAVRRRRGPVGWPRRTAGAPSPRGRAAALSRRRDCYAATPPTSPARRSRPAARGARTCRPPPALRARAGRLAARARRNGRGRGSGSRPRPADRRAPGLPRGRPPASR